MDEANRLRLLAELAEESCALGRFSRWVFHQMLGCPPETVIKEEEVTRGIS
jgi:hypothetical protein